MKHPLATRPGAFGPAVLALADGSQFHGVAIGADGATVGEVVFNTAMTGYQEIVSDRSYTRQLVTLTYPHIGNTGINGEDGESPRPAAAGLIVKDVPRAPSNHRATLALQEWLRCEAVVAIAGIDTRRLTRILRTHGAQNGAIITGTDGAHAVELARAFAGLNGMDLASAVTTPHAYTWTEGEWLSGGGFGRATERFHVVAYDFGVKTNILRMLAARGCRVTVVPARTGAADVLAMEPDGVFLSNGPGDPQPCDYAIDAAREFMDRAVPTFGICLGHQIMALACGAKTLKMKFGHHGANHPVQELDTGRVFITSQNHGFAVDQATLPANCRTTHVSLFDGSLQGFARVDRPAFCFQGHPEAAPGPHDIGGLFDRFVALMENQHA